MSPAKPDRPFFTLDRAAMEKNAVSFFAQPHQPTEKSEALESSTPDALSRTVSQLLQEDFYKNKSQDEIIAVLAAKEREERALEAFLARFTNEATADSLDSPDTATRILNFYSHKTQPSTLTCSEGTQHCPSSSSPPTNHTWPAIRPSDLKADDIFAQSALLFKAGREFSTGSTKRPRVDPHTLLQPVARLRIADKVVFVQYTPRFFIGCDSVKRENEAAAMTANGLNVSNNYFDVSPFCQAENAQLCKYQLGVFFDQAANSFHVIPYGNSAVRLIRQDETSVALLDNASSIQDGDIVEMAGVQLAFEVISG